MTRPFRWLFVGLISLLFLGGCATLSPDFEEPSLQVNSIRLKRSNSLAPEFEISLRVTNPNRDALDIEGMAYTLNLAGNKLLSGVANDLPTVGAYGEADLKISATLSLFGGFKLLNDLMNEYQESIQYELNVRLDVGAFYPDVTIKKEGVFVF